MWAVEDTAEMDLEPHLVISIMPHFADSKHPKQADPDDFYRAAFKE